MTGRQVGRGGYAPPRIPVRLRALSVLAGTLGALGALAVGGGGRPDPSPARVAPFRPAPAEGHDGAGRPVGVPAPGDGVLLYVSQTCPFCATELSEWARALEGAGAVRPPRVVLSPDSDARSPDYLPPVLREDRVHDRTGAIARAFGVRAVPFLAELDGTGLVLGAWVGTTPPERLERLLLRLRDPYTEARDER
ncbi:MAG TPA: hypothetical protein VK849_09680 [Longimicrobiales bacterium]|nr:hypothetical protein [Longimicrobiales bacterium]